MGFQIFDPDGEHIMKPIATILLFAMSLAASGKSGPDRGPAISRQQLIDV